MSQEAFPPGWDAERVRRLIAHYDSLDEQQVAEDEAAQGRAAADAIDREVAGLAASEKFMSFLEKRVQKPGCMSLEEIERRLGMEPQ